MNVWGAEKIENCTWSFANGNYFSGLEFKIKNEVNQYIVKLKTNTYQNCNASTSSHV